MLSSETLNTVGLQKFEVDGNVVHFYFDYVSVKSMSGVNSSQFTSVNS
jgi:hypothetical protein